MLEDDLFRNQFHQLDMGLPKLAEPLGKTPTDRSSNDLRVPGEALEQRPRDLEQVRRELLNGAAGLAASARRVMRWRAVLSWLAVGLAALLVLLLADVLLRREELGLRLLALAAWLLLLAWTAIKLLRPAWRFSLTPVQAAQWLEGERPELGHQLSTAVELAGLPVADTRYGSGRFREAALRAWVARGQSLNWPAHLQQSGLRRALGMLLIACGLCVAVAIVWPAEMRLAVARFTAPWGSNAWPRRDHLQIAHLPTVIAEDSELQLEVIDERPPLPERVELQVRSAGPADNADVRVFETTVVGDVAVGNLPSMNAAFEVRAVGGDDRRMPWHRVEVVQPPELSEFQFVVQPPAYTGLGRSGVVGRRIAVLAGSQVEFSGRFDRPVASVEVQLAEPSAGQAAEPSAETEPSDAAQQEWVATLSDDGRGLRLGAAGTAMLDMQQSLSWQLLVTTADGLEVLLRERWAIEVTVDEPPRIIFQTADMLELASDAQLSLRGEASDDLGLVEIRGRLQLSSSDSAAAAIHEIWRAQAADSLADGRTHGEAASSEPSSGLSRTHAVAGELPRELAIDAAWDIARVGDFVAGQRLEVWLEARDSADQWSQSQIQYFEIRDSSAVIESIQARQNQLLTQVRELVDTQRRNSQLFSRTWELTQQLGKVQREQLDPLRNAAQVQRAVADRLGSSDAQGLSQEIAKLRELLRANRLDETTVAVELQELAASVQSLVQGPLARASEATRHTAALAEAASAADASIAENLASSAEQTQAAQAAALSAMEGLLGRLARSESLQQATAELAQILNQQNAIRSETDRLQLATLSSTSDVSSAELQAEQTALSSDQQGLARRLDDWLNRSRELQAQPEGQQRVAQEALARATQSLLSAQASAQMRRSTEEIRDQQLARAAATQQQVSELLAESLRQMGAAHPSQLGTLRNRAEGLRQLGGELSELAKTQAELSERWQAPAESELEQLLGDQADAHQRTSDLSLQAEQAGSASLAAEIDRASTAQQRAQQAGQQNEFQQAEQASRQAAGQLAQTSAQLEQRAAALEQQAAEQQMFELSAAIEELMGQQQPITTQFSQWAELAAADSAELRQQQQADMRGAAARQEAVRQVLRELRGETSELPVFDWTLQQSESAMGRAVAAAQRYRIKPDAQDAAERALRLLRLAADALRNARAADSQPADPNSADEPADQADFDDPSSQADDSATRPAPMLASLKLLRNLQQELNQQTQTAEASADVVGRMGQLGELARLQQELAAQVEQLLNSQP